ncbi:hypothetical protein AB0129_25225, partial [Klebsiella pneumoniae]
DHLPLLEDQNPVRRSEILAGTGSATLALTEAIKSLSNVSGRDADIANNVLCNSGAQLAKCLIIHQFWHNANTT